MNILKNFQATTSVLLVLFIAESTVLVQADFEGFDAEREREMEEMQAMEEAVDAKIFCSDAACTGMSGSCRSILSFWTSCRELNTTMCGNFCACCLPCSGTCGDNDDGTCKRWCNANEEQITGCQGRNCKCCRTIQKCGTGDTGSCKSSCNTNIEDEDASGTCTTTGYKCCIPKTGCTAKCGFQYRFDCKNANECPFWQWQFGSCPSGCRCCGSLFG